MGSSGNPGESRSHTGGGVGGEPTLTLRLDLHLELHCSAALYANEQNVDNACLATVCNMLATKIAVKVVVLRFQKKLIHLVLKLTVAPVTSSRIE